MMDSTYKLFSFLIFLATVAEASYFGCYEESVRHRHFSVSPGDYNPEQMTILTCMSSCGAFSYEYAALTLGKFCYCSNSLPTASPVSESFCNMTCLGDTRVTCGGSRHVNVYSASKRITGLMLSSDVVGTVISVGTEVNLAVSISSGNEVVYKFDYDDGSALTSPNVTNMLRTTYNVPGEYTVLVKANDVNQTFQDQIAATTVRVDAPPGKVEVECDPVFGTYEEGECVCTVWWGSSLKIAVDVSTFSLSFFIEDPPLSLAGPAFSDKDVQVGDGTAAVYLLHAAEFSVSGRILGWEMMVSSTAAGNTVEVLILKPSCSSGAYCYSSNNCQSSCLSSSGRATSCPVGEQFCVQAATCTPTCSPATSRYASSPGAYQVIEVVTVSVLATGFQYVAVTTDIEVEPGYILGLKQGSSNAVIGRVGCAVSDECDVQLSSTSAPIGTTLTVPAAKMITRHAIRAIASGGSKVYLPFTFEVAGNLTLTASASSTTLTSQTPMTTNTIVVVLEGINASAIANPLYAATGDSVVFTVLPHTGSDVYYNWTTSDGDVLLATRDQSISHTFSTNGIYFINVTTYNAVSQKNNMTNITIQDRVKGLTISASPTAVGALANISMSLTNGSDYICSWNFGDGSPIQTTDETSTPPSGAIRPHSFSKAGNFNVSVVCSNEVSTSVAQVIVEVQEVITNLRLVSGGAEKDQDFVLDWQVDAGTEITFKVNFDGQNINSFSNTSKYRWKSETQKGRPPSSIPLTITASNLISNLSLSVDFKILTLIVNPEVKTGSQNVSSHETVTFTVDMSAGSDVTVTIDYGDGVVDNYTQAAGAPWTTPVNFNHIYLNGGRFTVVTTFSNAAGTFTKSVQVLVLVGVGAVNCSLVNYALYYPPANVNLTFLATALPTEPELTLNWGEPQSQDLHPQLQINTPYPHTFGDTGTYMVTANLTNLMGHKSCLMPITIVEKLIQLTFNLTFPKAAKDLPFAVTVCMYRGASQPICNMTYDYGDGNVPKVYPRTGAGKNGCDTTFITYTDLSPKNITVTVTSVLETVEATKQVEVINGIREEDVKVIEYGPTEFQTPTTLTLQYNGAIMPTSASVRFEYGDGSTLDIGPFSFSISASGGTQDFSHKYEKDGLFATKLILYNDATSVVKIIPVGVYRDFLDPRAEVFYLSEIPPNEKTYGLNKQPDLFPANKPIYFEVSDSNNAFATEYQVSITNSNGDNILTTSFNTSLFSIQLNQNDVYKVSISVKNPLHSAALQQKVIKVFELVEGLSILEAKSQVQRNEVKAFTVSLLKVGTQTCMWAIFSDGFTSLYSDNPDMCNQAQYGGIPAANKYGLSRVNQIEHVFTSDGYFTLTVKAENNQSSEQQEVGFSITGLDCSKPTVDIHNRHHYFTNPAVFKRSNRIILEGLSNIQCSVSYSNIKSWRIELMNETYNTKISDIPLTGLDTTQAQLNIKPLFLNYGLYKIIYSMTMTGPYGGNKFESEIHTYVRVEKSDLVAVMMAGGASDITRGTSQTLVLDPLAYSLDPDVDPSSPQGLSVKNWTCEMVGNSSVGCTTAGFVATVQSQTLIVGALEPNIYKITAYLVKDTRITSTTIRLTVVSGNPPVLSVQPIPGSVFYQLPEGYKILRSSRFALDCVCTSCISTDTPAYSWTVQLFDYRWSDSWRILEPEDIEGRVVGQFSSQISIQPTLFDLFSAIDRWRVQCQVALNGVSANVSSVLLINAPPVPGSCAVSPFNHTITTENAWTIQGDGWSEEDGIAEYQFMIHIDDNTVDKQITSVVTSKSNFQLNVSLSEGPDYNNYQQTVIVKVKDILGGISTMICNIVVVPALPVTQVRAITQDMRRNQLNEMNRIFAEGDQKTCTERATNIVSLLNSDSKQSRSEYAGQKLASNFANSMYGEIDQGRPSFMQENPAVQNAWIEFQMESQRNDRAWVRANVINKVLQLDVTQTVTSVQQVASFLDEATRYGDEINQATQLKVMKGLQDMIGFLTNPANINNVPPEEVEVAQQSIMAVIGNIMDAAGNNGFNPTLDEAKAAQEDSKWFEYDTSLDALGGSDDLSSVGSFEDALKAHTARIHKVNQATTAETIRNEINNVFKNMVTCFSRNTVPNQSLVMKSLKMKLTMEKASIDDLMGKEIQVSGSQGGVVLPNTTFLDGLGQSEPVVITVSQSTNYALRYSAMAQRITPYSNFISVNVYTANDSKQLEVQGLSEPMEITIPRDANMKKSDYMSINPMIPSWSKLMNMVVKIQWPDSAVHLDFKNIDGRQFLLVISKGKIAKVAENSSDDQCDFLFLHPTSMSQNLDDPNRNRFFISNKIIGEFTGQLFVGIRELNSTEYDMDVSEGCSSLPRYVTGVDNFRGNFSVLPYVSQCLSISDNQSDWSTAGCEVSYKTNASQTCCNCYHLTTFAGGWVVVPNTIDWGYVFSNADFLKNPTIYITVIVTAVLYILFAVMARRKDKKLAEQLGIAPLADNDPRDKYFYEMVVSTGMRRNAGTDSQVFFILSGEDDETEVRAFSDSKRKIFRRGQVDGFLLAVPRPLGYLNFMRVWHDNSGRGKFASWYLNYIAIRDIQTDTRYLFIANRWLAVEEDDGQIDRVIPVANHEQMSDFSYNFGERSRKDFADGHLWFSVIARPPQSRFTCLQRVSCCLCLLYLTMLANAMFYNTAPSQETASNSFNFGPFSVSPEQIFIGVVSNLIVFPVNFLLVFLFKKSRPHHKRPSRIDLAIKEVQDGSKQTHLNDIRPEVSSIFSVSKTPCFPQDPHHPETSRPATAMSNTSTEELTPQKKKQKFELPWYFCILAWMLLWLVTLMSVVLVIFYGISFKDETCKKWITSMVVSFFMSVFITQPLKVILFALILSLIIKNPGEDEDEEGDEELPRLDQDGELLHGDLAALMKPKKVGYRPPDPQVLEKLREKRLKEIKMWTVIREVVVYGFFLWILMVISYRQMGASNFLYKNTLYKVFIDNKFTDIDFYAIRNTDEFWKWTSSGLVNGLRAGAYYNDYPPLKLRAYINDKVSRILGYATMRQLRIKPGECSVPGPMNRLIHECNEDYDMFKQEERDFRTGWLPMIKGDTINDTREEYIYRSAKELNGYPYWGILSWYSGGGYVFPLKGSKDDLVQQMKALQAEQWIDRYTRAVFIEFTVYNPQVNLFAVSTILAEFDPSGGMVASVRFEPAMLLPYMTSAMLFQIVCEIVYILFCVFFILKELRELFKTKLRYFQNFWNLVEVGIIAMSIAGIVVFFYRLLITTELTKRFKETNGNGYVKFQYAGYWNEMFSYMIGFLCFLATIKFLKLLRFNRKMSMLSATLQYSASSLIQFGLIFLIVFLAFSQLFYLSYMHIDIDYSTFVSSMVSGILMMMGKYDIYSMIMAEPVLTQIFVLLFVVTVTFIMVNMFVTILNETFAAVREDINKQGNDYEIVDFMLGRFKQWTGLGTVSDESSTGKPEDFNNKPGLKGQNSTDHVGNFPDRIERLLQTISSVYMDSDNLAQLYQKKPYESQHGNKNLFTAGLSSVAPLDYKQKRKSSSDIVARVQTQ